MSLENASYSALNGTQLLPYISSTGTVVFVPKNAL